MSVNWNISSLAREYSSQRSRSSRSISENFHRLSGSLEPILEASVLFLVRYREPVLHEDDPGADEHALELGAVAEELQRPPPTSRSPSLARHLRGCTRSGRTARSPRPPEGARRSAGRTTACVLARSVWAERPPSRRERSRGAVIRLMVPPLPAAPRPSNRTTTLRPWVRTHSWSFTSSRSSRASSSSYRLRESFRRPTPPLAAGGGFLSGPLSWGCVCFGMSFSRSGVTGLDVPSRGDGPEPGPTSPVRCPDDPLGPQAGSNGP